MLRFVAFHFRVEVQRELVGLLIGTAIAFEVQPLVVVSAGEDEGVRLEKFRFEISEMVSQMISEMITEMITEMISEMITEMFNEMINGMI